MMTRFACGWRSERPTRPTVRETALTAAKAIRLRGVAVHLAPYRVSRDSGLRRAVALPRGADDRVGGFR